MGPFGTKLLYISERFIAIIPVQNLRMIYSFKVGFSNQKFFNEMYGYRDHHYRNRNIHYSEKNLNEEYSIFTQ